MLAKTDNRDKIVSQLEQILEGGSDPAQVQIFAREAREAVIYDSIQAAREKISATADDPFVATALEDLDPEISKLPDYQPFLESVAAIIGTAVSGPSDNEEERIYARGLVADIVDEIKNDLVRVSEDIAERIQEYQDRLDAVTSESPNRFQERETKTGLRKAIGRAQYLQEKFGTILGIAGYRADAEEPDMTGHADALTGHEEEEREEQVPGKVTFHADDWYTARELEEQLGIDGLTVTENRQELQDQLEAAGAVQRRAAAGAPYEINAKYLHHVLPKDVRSKWELVGGRSKPLPDTERDEEEEAAEPETQRQTTPPPPPAHPDGMVEIDVAKSYTVDELTDMFGVSRNTIASRLYKRGDQLREKDAIRQRGEKHNSPLEIDGQHIGVLIPAYAQHRIKLVGESAADTLEETVKGQQRPATPPEPQAPKAKTVVECPSPDGMVSIYAGQDYSARELTGLFGLPKTSVGSNLNRKFEQLSADGKAHLREDGRNPQVIMGAYVTEVLPEKVHDRVKLVEGEAPTLEETVASEAGKTAEETKKVPPAEDGTIMLDPKAYYTMNELSEATGVKKTSLAPKMSVKKAELEQAGAVEYKDEANRTVIAVLGSYAHLVLPARVRERMQLIGAQEKEPETPATEPAPKAPAKKAEEKKAPSPKAAPAATKPQATAAATAGVDVLRLDDVVLLSTAKSPEEILPNVFYPARQIGEAFDYHTEAIVDTVNENRGNLGDPAAVRRIPLWECDDGSDMAVRGDHMTHALPSDDEEAQNYLEDMFANRKAEPSEAFLPVYVGEKPERFHEGVLYTANQIAETLGMQPESVKQMIMRNRKEAPDPSGVSMVMPAGVVGPKRFMLVEGGYAYLAAGKRKWDEIKGLIGAPDTRPDYDSQQPESNEGNGGLETAVSGTPTPPAPGAATQDAAGQEAPDNRRIWYTTAEATVELRRRTGVSDTAIVSRALQGAVNDTRYSELTRQHPVLKSFQYHADALPMIAAELKAN